MKIAENKLDSFKATLTKEFENVEFKRYELPNCVDANNSIQNVVNTTLQKLKKKEQLLRGSKMALLHPYRYRELCEGVEYVEIVPAGTVCEYVTHRKEKFISKHRLKEKLIESTWDVWANGGLKLPQGHIINIPLPACDSSALITVNDEFLNKYFFNNEVK